MSLSLIAAMSENNVIGINGDLPWYLPADLKRFASITGGKTIVMGSKTYLSIMKKNGVPLKGRKHFVLSQTLKQKPFPQVEVFKTWQELQEQLPSGEEAFVIGGAIVFELALPYCERMLLTKVHTIVSGDTFFPKINLCDWLQQSSEFNPCDEKNVYDMTFLTYTRVQD